MTSASIARSRATLAAHTNPPLADCNPMQAAGYVHDAAAKATGDICAARIKAAEQLPEAEFFRECASARAAQRVILDATEAAWQAIVAAHRPGVL